MNKQNGFRNPKTKQQRLVFTLIMVVVMVYFMTVYNAALEGGLSYSTFLSAFRTMWPEVVAAFLAQQFIAAPLARKLVGQIVDTQSEKRVFVQIAMAGCMVFIMAPCMTLFVNILHHGFSPDMPLFWLKKLVINFPFALCIQVFYVGPLVRLIYHTLYRRS